MAATRKSDDTPTEKPVDASKIVGDYPERPYSEAITDEHREVLSAKGIEVDPS